MGFPKTSDLEPIILEELVKMGGEGFTTEIYERVAKHFPHLSQAEMEHKYDRGDTAWPTYIRSIKWLLVKNGDVVSSARGKWKITDKGKGRISK